jgi:lipid-binding SYLF domain-containing protein
MFSGKINSLLTPKPRKKAFFPEQHALVEKLAQQKLSGDRSATPRPSILIKPEWILLGYIIGGPYGKSLLYSPRITKNNRIIMLFLIKQGCFSLFLTFDMSFLLERRY